MLTVEPKVGDGVADGRDQVLGIVPRRRRPHVDAIVADRIEPHEAGAAGSVQHLAKTVVRLLGLVVSVGADQPVEDLADRQRQVLAVLVEHGVDLLEQRQALGARPPRRKTTGAGHQLSAASSSAARKSVSHWRWRSIRWRTFAKVFGANIRAAAATRRAGWRTMDGKSF